jgi:hypothetical protein
MPYLRRYLPPLLILLPLIFICGKLLLTPVELQLRPVSSAAEVCGGMSPVVVPIGQGWPWVFCEYSSLHWLSPNSPAMYHYLFLIADLSCLATIIALAGFLLMRHYRRRGAWLRFTLRELMLLIALVTLGLGWFQHHRTLQAREATTLAKIGGSSAARTNIEYCGPQWLRRLWPHRELTPFHRVTRLSITASTFEKQSSVALADVLPKFSQLCHVDWYGEWDDKGKQQPLSQTRKQSIANFLPHPSAYATIKYLYLYDREIDDDWLKVLDSMPELRALGLDYSRITDGGLEAISRISAIEHLRLMGSKSITDEGVRHLLELPNLKTLALPGQISKRRIEQLKKRNPSLEVVQYRND